MFWYFLGAAIGLCINIALSNAFAGFAEEKGYARGKYFWLCFFFGILGYVWVAGLPDTRLQFRIAALEYDIRHTATNVTSSKQQNNPCNTTEHSSNTPLPQNGYWKCKCGRANPPYLTTCNCGTRKRDMQQS